MLLSFQAHPPHLRTVAPRPVRDNNLNPERTVVSHPMTGQTPSRARAAAAIRALRRWYDPASGLWQGTGWWNAANALTAVIGYTKLTGDGSYAGIIGTTFTAAQ